MTGLRSSIGVAANADVNVAACEFQNFEEIPGKVVPITDGSGLTGFNKEIDTSIPVTREVEVKIAPFINEILFKGEQTRLRLVGGDFILETYRSNSDLIEVETMKCKWSDLVTQNEWDSMSVQVKQMIVNGNPVKLSNGENPRNYVDSKNIYARISYPNSQIRFWKKDENTFEFQLRYGYREYCRGTSEKSDMDLVRNSFRNIQSSIKNNGRILNVKEQNEIVDPQEDYETGEGSIVKVLIGDNSVN